MSTRAPDPGKALLDAMAGFLASKGGYDHHVETLGEVAWEAYVRELLASDARFVEVSAGRWALAKDHEARHAAFMGAAA